MDALSDTGVRSIQFTSFVSPKWVPQMADAEAFVTGIKRVPGVRYEAIWLNRAGFERALQLKEILNLKPSFALAATDTFSRKNTNRTTAERLDELPEWIAMYRAAGFDDIDVGIMAAFGCNYEGDVEPAAMVRLLEDVERRAADAGARLGSISLADTMGWGSPRSTKRLVGAVRERFPSHSISLHLHDTRALAIANIVAAMELGIEKFDSAVAGLGGCPFAAHKGAAGNVCTEDVVFLCEELGIDTGIERMIEASRLAEKIVGHDLPGKLKQGGSLAASRARASATAAAAVA